MRKDAYLRRRKQIELKIENLRNDLIILEQQYVNNVNKPYKVNEKVMIQANPDKVKEGYSYSRGSRCAYVIGYEADYRTGDIKPVLVNCVSGGRKGNRRIKLYPNEQIVKIK